MEEPGLQRAASESENRPEQRRRRRTRHHGLLHLHRAQKKLLARAGAFLTLLAVIILVWYWVAVKR